MTSVEETPEEYFNPDTGELMLGDIVISVDKVKEQAEKYGHSETRELAFLVAHSMLHLCGYDHMEDEERLDDGRKAEGDSGTEGVTGDEKAWQRGDYGAGGSRSCGHSFRVRKEDMRRQR